MYRNLVYTTDTLLREQAEIWPYVYTSNLIAGSQKSTVYTGVLNRRLLCDIRKIVCTNDTAAANLEALVYTNTDIDKQ